MYDADYEDWVRQQNEYDSSLGLRGEPVGEFQRYNPSEGKYETKDSGKRFESPDGMVRDTSEGKPQFTLMFPKDIPFEDQLMTRVADLYHRGGVKYGPRNWEKSSTEEALAKHEDCLMRHVVKFLLGVEDGEDHAAAIVWNVNAVDLTRYKIKNTLKEVQPETYPTESELAEKAKAEIAKEKSDAEFIAKTGAVVEFAVGDELLDKNNDWWEFYGDGDWERSDHHANWWKRSFEDLVKDYAPLYIQTGAFAGLTILKDGSKRWG